MHRTHNTMGKGNMLMFTTMLCFSVSLHGSMEHAADLI